MRSHNRARCDCVRTGYVGDMAKVKRDAVDQLQYEDTVLRRLLYALDDESRDHSVHGRIAKLFVERLAVREAARELVGEAITSVPELSSVSARLDARVPRDRKDLDHLDELTRGIRTANINQAQDVDAEIAGMVPRLLAEIDEDVSVVIPAVRQRLSPRNQAKLLPTASYVLRHCPLHPGPHRRQWYDRIGLLVWLHAIYDYLRSLPVGGIKPRSEIAIPGEGLVYAGPTSRLG